MVDAARLMLSMALGLGQLAWRSFCLVLGRESLDVGGIDSGRLYMLNGGLTLRKSRLESDEQDSSRSMTLVATG